MRTNTRTDVSNLTDADKINGFCKSSVFGEIFEDGTYSFTDLRTKVNYDALKQKDSLNFTRKDVSPLTRLIAYELSGTDFDLDYCANVRKKYEFCVMSDLYYVLFGVDVKENELVNSAETLISPTLNITRCLRNSVKLRRGMPPGIDWDWLQQENDLCKGKFPFDPNNELASFAYNVTTLGNFMPVPKAYQKQLHSMEERNDKVLNLFRAYYVCYFSDRSIDFILSDAIKEWLMSYLQGDASHSWKNFVNSNFLKGSFVDENYNVNNYDGTLRQLSDILYQRSVVMLQEYENRITNDKSDMKILDKTKPRA